MMEILFGIGGFVALLVLGWAVGGTIERNHFRDLDRREAEHAGIRITQLKSFPDIDLQVATQLRLPTMLCSEVVISSDYLKSYLGSWKKLFGGEIRSFRSIMERARREALLRLVEQAVGLGYNALCNVRLETADLAGRESQQKKAMVVATVLASATAYTAHDRNEPQPGTTVAEMTAR